MGTATPPPPRSAGSPAPQLVARERELGDLAEILAGDGDHAAALVLVGEPGIGKTSLWEEGVALGRARGRRVLSARTSEAETGLPFAAVIDLFDGVTDEDLAALPSPQ